MSLCERGLTGLKLSSIILGGFFGAITRYYIGEWIHKPNGFPFGTLSINLFGCFILGWFLTYFTLRKKIRPEFILLIGTGFIGSFTTFSTFSVESILLFHNGLVVYGLLYASSSIVFGLLLAYLGFKLALFNVEKGETH